jgi:hypothetical protein
MARSCEHEPFRFHKTEEFLDLLSDYQSLRTMVHVISTNVLTFHTKGVRNWKKVTHTFLIFAWKDYVVDS